MSGVPGGAADGEIVEVTVTPPWPLCAGGGGGELPCAGATYGGGCGPDDGPSWV